MLSYLQQKLSPPLRGAAFYGLFWGTIGVFGPFIFVHFERLGVTPQQIGILSMTLPVCTLVVSPLVSRLADRLNKRVMVLAVLALLYAFGLASLSLPRVFLHVLFGLLAVNILRGPIEPIANSIIVRMSSHYGFNFGRVRMAGSIFFTVTAIGLGALWQEIGFDWMFYTAGVVMLLTAVSASLLEDKTPPPVKTEKKAGIGIIFKDWVLLVILASSFMVGAAVMMQFTFTSIYVDQIRAGELVMGLIMGMAAVGEIPSMEFGVRIIKRLGDIKALLAAYILLALGMALFGFFTHPLGLILVSLLRGAGYALYFVASVMVIDRRAPHYLASTYQSISMSIAWGLAPLLSGAVSGWLYQSIGAQDYFLVCGAVVVVAGLILLPVYLFSKEKAT